MSNVPGVVIAAPASGSGKTTLTLALLRHLERSGVAVSSLKVGPDYIDPAFHAAASARHCHNLDLWAMRESTARAVVARASEGSDLVIAEGVMGLFDGAVGDRASTADVAAATGWPVVLIIDVHGMAASVAALVHGFATWREDVRIGGVVFNRTGSDRHARLLRDAVATLGIPVLGHVPRDEGLSLPSRHLGLVQATEQESLDAFLDYAGARVARYLDVGALRDLAVASDYARPAGAGPLPPPGQRIAVARDAAFTFLYEATLDGWRAAGASVIPFSPLADEPPATQADAVYLPGGYPELHADRLSGNRAFLEGLRAAASRGALVYGECGGYMVLGEGLVGAGGESHAMAGLLPLETSFSDPALTLGYRAATCLADGPFGERGERLRGHEFHLARVLREEGDEALYACESARGDALGPSGLRRGNVMGSFVHLVDRAGPEG